MPDKSTLYDLHVRFQKGTEKLIAFRTGYEGFAGDTISNTAILSGHIAVTQTPVACPCVVGTRSLVAVMILIEVLIDFVGVRRAEIILVEWAQITTVAAPRIDFSHWASTPYVSCKQ